MKKPQFVWVAWCQRCQKCAVASEDKQEVLTDCPYCPPDTPTEAIPFRRIERRDGNDFDAGYD